MVMNGVVVNFCRCCYMGSRVAFCTRDVVWVNRCDWVVVLLCFLHPVVSDSKRKASGLLVGEGGVAIGCGNGHGELDSCWNCYGILP